jgi:hypothetical protein
MRTLRLLLVVILVASVTGCAAGGDESDSTRPTTSPGTSPTTSPGTSPGTPRPVPPATPDRPSGATPATGSTTGPTTAPPDGDRRGDPVRGVRTVRGVVERSGEWTLLRDTTGGRWALLGERARLLRTGAQVEVRGTVTTPPAGCPVDRALTVTQTR